MPLKVKYDYLTGHLVFYKDRPMGIYTHPIVTAALIGICASAIGCGLGLLIFIAPMLR